LTHSNPNYKQPVTSIHIGHLRHAALALFMACNQLGHNILAAWANHRRQENRRSYWAVPDSATFK